MKKLSKEQVTKLKLSKKKDHPVYDAAGDLKIGEGIFISKLEWDEKSPVAVALNNRFKKTMKFSTNQKDGGTYIIRRK